MCENNYESCIWQCQSEWFTPYHTNPSHEVPLSFVWLKFSSFGWDIDMRRIRSGKTLRLGMPKATKGNIQGRLKRLSSGMPRKASPLSSSKPSVYLTRSYIFICHMICVLLGAYFHYTYCFNKSLDLKSWMRESPPWLANYFTTHCSSLISFWSSLSFTRVLHIYPMSKWLNELNIINLKLYMFYMLIPWGVMTSHTRSRGCKFIEG